MRRATSLTAIALGLMTACSQNTAPQPQSQTQPTPAAPASTDQIVLRPTNANPVIVTYKDENPKNADLVFEVSRDGIVPSAYVASAGASTTAPVTLRGTTAQGTAYECVQTAFYGLKNGKPIEIENFLYDQIGSGFPVDRKACKSSPVLAQR